MIVFFLGLNPILILLAGGLLGMVLRQSVRSLVAGAAALMPAIRARPSDGQGWRLMSASASAV